MIKTSPLVGFNSPSIIPIVVVFPQPFGPNKPIISFSFILKFILFTASLDLYFLLTARLNNYKIIERPLVIYKRVAGEAKGGGTLFTKIKLTLRTLNYVYNLKKRKKF